MRDVKTPQGTFRFSVNEWLSSNQIRSYFSRMRMKNAKRFNGTISSNRSLQWNSSFVEEEQEEQEEEQGEGDDEEGSFEVETILSQQVLAHLSFVGVI